MSASGTVTKILLVGDFRSVHAIGFAERLGSLGYDIGGFSSHSPERALPFPCHIAPVWPRVRRIIERFLPSTFGQALPTAKPKTGSTSRRQLALVPYQLFRIAVAALDAISLRRYIARQRPDIIHAMRIPYEGVSTYFARSRRPITTVVSIWGNDLTLHATYSDAMSRISSRLLSTVDGLLVDCHRDAELAQAYGLQDVPVVNVPVNGGLDLSMFRPAASRKQARLSLGLPPTLPLITNPRGPRQYVCTSEFIEALGLLRNSGYAFQAALTGFADNTWMRDRIAELGLEAEVAFPETMTQRELARWLQASDLVVSPSLHDGTPNSVLEAMACGAFPIVGDIPSLHEIVRQGENGFMCDPASPSSIAEAMATALDDPARRQQAALDNQLVVKPYSTPESTTRLVAFYRELGGAY